MTRVEEEIKEKIGKKRRKGTAERIGEVKVGEQQAGR